MDDTYLLTRSDIGQKLGIRKHRSTWIRWEKEGKFPKGIRLGSLVYYPWSQVRASLTKLGLYPDHSQTTI